MTPDVHPSLAVVDSGVGGLSVLTELRRILPHNSIIYYADSANCPYGSRNESEIVSLTVAVVERVVGLGAQVVVVACNTMTAAAIDLLRQKWPGVDFVGMEPAVKPAATESKTGVVGILATRATLNGRLYKHTRDEYAANARVIETIGEGLVEFVERGEIDSLQCEALVRSYVMPMIEGGADRIVLGCTHYPFLTPVIERIIAGHDVKIINPAPAVARRAVELMARRGLVRTDGKAEMYYYSSGTQNDVLRLSQFLK